MWVFVWVFEQVLSIAVLLKVVMKRSFTVTQWEALVLLILGITVNQLACSTSPPGSVPEALSILAWVYTMMSVTIPSAASVYNEHALKSNFETSVHLQVQHTHTERCLSCVRETSKKCTPPCVDSFLGPSCVDKWVGLDVREPSELVVPPVSDIYQLHVRVQAGWGCKTT